jgi:hypothetical protein
MHSRADVVRNFAELGVGQGSGAASQRRLRFENLH